MLEADDFFGKFEFRPLEPGYGVTVGNRFAPYSPSPRSKALRLPSYSYSTG